MVEKINKQAYNFTVKNISYEIFFAFNGGVELCETSSPSNTGFIFENKKAFTLFINMCTDILEKELEKEKDEN